MGSPAQCSWEEEKIKINGWRENVKIKKTENIIFKFPPPPFLVKKK